MTIRTPLVLVTLGSALLLGACVAEPKPVTIQDKCAGAVASQAGVAIEAVRIEETVATAAGPKIYANAGGATYACQADLNGNITGAALQL